MANDKTHIEIEFMRSLLESQGYIFLGYQVFPLNVQITTGFHVEELSEADKNLKENRLRGLLALHGWTASASVITAGTLLVTAERARTVAGIV